MGCGEGLATGLTSSAPWPPVHAHHRQPYRLDLAAASAEEASPLLSRLLDTSLAAVAQLAGQGAVPAAAALAQAAAAAAAALLECVRGRGADVGGAMPAPLVLQASLEALLRALGAAHAAPRVRTPLWAALSSLLALVTPPEELAVPGPVLQIVMDGEAAGVGVCKRRVWWLPRRVRDEGARCP